MFALKKVMGRELSEDEKQEIRLWLSTHPKSTVPDAVTFFEDRFQTAITETCIYMRLIEATRANLI